jgi:hypothetical protein
MNERVRPVVEQLGIRPDDRHGVAATLICERLEGGRLTDRSAR